MTQQFQVKATSFLYLKYATNLRKGIPAQPLRRLWLQQKNNNDKIKKTLSLMPLLPHNEHFPPEFTEGVCGCYQSGLGPHSYCNTILYK